MKPKYKGKPQRKPFKKDQDFKEDKVNKINCNDPSWYIREGQLAKDVASFSFNTALGISNEIKADGTSVTGVVGKTLHIPGIMRIHTMPAVGYSRDGSSPINLAAKNLYSWVRHANSGHSNYDSPDLMMYLVAMDSIYAFIWHLQRAYGTARVYSQKNRYVGDALLEAMGFQANEVRANLADFRAYINMLITKVSAFCTPTTMSLFKRHTWMYSGVFKDEDVEKSQMYLYVPDFLYTYNEVNGAGLCEATPVLAKPAPSGTNIEWHTMPLSMWRFIGDGMISALVASEDINIMSGDIRKAYGENIWKISLIPEDYTVVPIYSGEILDQIHNTVFTGISPRSVLDPSDPTQWTYDISSFNIRQDPTLPDNPIIMTPFFGAAFNTAVEHFCDMEENEPSAERILVATRNMVHGLTQVHVGTDGSPRWLTELDSFGSDICFCAEMMQFQSNGTIAYYPVGINATVYLNAESYTKFHKAPIVYKFNTVGQTQQLEEVLGELGNYIVMDYTDIDKMHQSAILSMLGVPV